MFQRPEELRASIHELGTSVWMLAVLGALFESGLVEHLSEARPLNVLAKLCPGLSLTQLERCLDLAVHGGALMSEAGRYRLADAALPFVRQPLRAGLQGELRATLMQALALLDAASGLTPRHGWQHTNRALLQSQGDASAGLAAALKNMIVPRLGDLAARLERPGARFLDVGVGVGALAIALCRAYPQLEVVGLDVFDTALGMARENVSQAGLDARIELRQCAVEQLRDERAFELAWLPSFFIPAPALEQALLQVSAALRPGGWLLLATGAGGSDRTGATRALINELWGGARLEAAEAEALLRAAGFRDLLQLPVPAWAPAMFAARAPT